jgi:hypothetical protein
MSIKPPDVSQPGVSQPADTNSAEVARTDKAEATVAEETPAGGADGSAVTPVRVPEIGGPPGPEPTRYGDWQFNGRVTDF